jgi:hypothetical protein
MLLVREKMAFTRPGRVNVSASLYFWIVSKYDSLVPTPESRKDRTISAYKTAIVLRHALEAHGDGTSVSRTL